MNRIFFAVLAAVMILSLFACAADQPAAEDTSAPAETTAALPEETTAAETELTDNLPEVKMDGFEFKVYSSDTSGLCINDPSEEIGEEINDAMFRRNQKMEERFGFVLTIESEPKSNSLVATTLKNCSLAGDNAYQLYLPYTKTLIDYAQYLTPFNNIPHLDYSNPWWYPEPTSAFNFDGIQLALSGCFDLAVPSKVQCLVFNKELATELNLPKSLYDLVKDGEWTLDKLAEIGNMAARDLNGDGVMDQSDRFALSGHWKAMSSTFINAMGVYYATTDENGYPVFTGAQNEALVEAIMTMQDLLNNNPGLYRNKANKNYNHEGGGKFGSGTTFFHMSEIAAVSGSLRDLEFEVGVIPYPKLNREQTQYYSQTAYGHSPALCNALPKDQYEKVGILLEAFAFNTYTELLPVYKEKTLKTKTASDVESAEMVDLLWNATFYDFGILCWEGQLADKISNDLFMKNNSAVASYLTSLEPTMQRYTDNIRTAVTALKSAQ